MELSRLPVVLAVVAAVSLTPPAAFADTTTTGSTREEPLATDVCPEEYPELDPTDPAGTLYGPEPQPEHDLCSTWVTAHWSGYGDDAELTAVTFGLEVLGEVALRPDHAYEFSWEAEAPWDPDETCRGELLVTDGSVRPAVAYRPCRGPSIPIVDWLLRARYVHGIEVPSASVTVDGSVLEVTVPVSRSLHDELRAQLVAGGTLLAYCPITILTDPLAADVIHGGDVAFTAPEEP